MIKLYKTYNKVKHIFKKPILKFSFCKWKHSSLLPTWRYGNMIYLGKYGEYESTWYYAKFINSEWTELGKKNHPILSKLFKPVYQLPLWLSFYVFNLDVIWKTKWDEYRYEYPPQFTIVLFGWSFNWWLIPPTNTIEDADDYWESILYYLDFKDDPDCFDKIHKYMGHTFLHFGTDKEVKSPCFKSSFLK